MKNAKHDAILFGFDFILAVLVPVFLIFILLGQLTTPKPQPDDIVILSTLATPIIIPFTRPPVNVIYDITSVDKECFVGNILPFSDCGYKKYCTGNLYPKNSAELKLTTNSVKCNNYTGYVRVKYTDI